jgi:hypothetical protein
MPLAFLKYDAVDMEILKQLFLERLTGADYWIAVAFLMAGWGLWVWLGKTQAREKRIFSRQIASLLVVVLLAGGTLWVKHACFQREPVFSTNLTGVLVLRIVGDDERNSLQGDLVESLNRQLKKEPGLPIEVHLGRGKVDTDGGLASAHEVPVRSASGSMRNLSSGDGKEVKGDFIPTLRWWLHPKIGV